MKRRHAFLVFFFLLAASVCAGLESLWRTSQRMQQEVNNALALTLQRCEPDRIDADTIRVYRSLITTPLVRNSAYLSLAVNEETGGRRRPVLKASTGLTLSLLWHLSDQRTSMWLAVLSLLWLAGGMLLPRQLKDEGAPFAPSEAATETDGTVRQLGILCFDEKSSRFMVNGREVHFTPMQHALMELFLQAPDHMLPQQEICDRLWPKKPDASATLYTLVRRLKPILEGAAGLQIACERGRAYQLLVKEQ